MVELVGGGRGKKPVPQVQPIVGRSADRALQKPAAGHVGAFDQADDLFLRPREAVSRQDKSDRLGLPLGRGQRQHDPVKSGKGTRPGQLPGSMSTRIEPATRLQCRQIDVSVVLDDRPRSGLRLLSRQNGNRRQVHFGPAPVIVRRPAVFDGPAKPNLPRSGSAEPPARFGSVFSGLCDQDRFEVPPRVRHQRQPVQFGPCHRKRRPKFGPPRRSTIW